MNIAYCVLYSHMRGCIPLFCQVVCPHFAVTPIWYFDHKDEGDCAVAIILCPEIGFVGGSATETVVTL